MAENSSSELINKYFDKVRLTFPEVFLSNDQLMMIFNSCSTEDELKTITYYLGHTLQSMPDKKEAGLLLFHNVDDSQYQLDQWIKAIHFFHQWLESEGRKTTFPKLLGYIHCCTESPENKTIKYDLKDILKDMIETYGYVG